MYSIKGSNKIFMIIFSSLFFFSCDSFNFKVCEKTREYSLSIDSIRMGAMEGDSDPSEFSVLIAFTNHGMELTDWHLGFYMCGTPLSKFVRGNQNFNPRIIRRICDSQNNCKSLKYERAKNIRDVDLSQGYTTIHSPDGIFPLTNGETYTIELLHINQWGGGNVSYFPQNFFLLVGKYPHGQTNKDSIYFLDTDISSYSVVGYDQSKVDSEIKSHIQSNWDNAINKESQAIDIGLIPTPVSVSIQKGYYTLSSKTIKVKNFFNDDYTMTDVLKNVWEADFSVQTNTYQQEDTAADIVIKRLKSPEAIRGNLEGYTIEVNDNGIVISAITNAGVYYAFQTLSQLLSYAKDNKLPYLSIIDYPRFRYRGVLLDTARHFFTVDEIKSFLDLMAAHKLNTLHFHLSDDEAFRVAIPFYPSIQSVGNTRGFGMTMGPMMFPQGNLYDTYKSDSFVHASNNYSGTYTAEDIREIVSYANKHQITVIPEIDLPAHARALIKSMPDVFVDPNDTSNYLSVQGYSDDVLPVCTYNTEISVGPRFTKTIDRIVNMVAGLFNNQHTVYAINKEVSIAGDEVSPNAWTHCTSCQGAWKSLTALQKSHKFFQEMANSNSNIILSGWQQFVQTDGIELGKDIVPPHRVGHVWVWNSSEPGISQAVQLANGGFPTVLAFSDKTYFDLVYTPDIRETGFAWATDYSDTYAALSSAEIATKVINGAKSEAKDKIIGLEGALWSEHLASFDQLIYMAIPKMAGLSEASWSPNTSTGLSKNVNWRSLAKRLGCGKSGFLHYLNKLYGIRYRGYPNGIKLEVPEGVCQSLIN